MSLRELFGEEGHEAAERIGTAAAADLTNQIFGKEPTLEECFGAHPSPEALAANQRAADLSMKDMTEVMSKEDRKGLLIQLVQDYGVAINDGCYESECGSLQAMTECHEEEKRLLAEIIKMIEEGV